MPLTPEEIVDADLKLALRGYATDQVDELLDRLADQVERNEQELAGLRARLQDAEARAAAAAETEATLRRTLVTAQTTADRMIAEAEAAAAELREHADQDAAARLEAARQEADRVESEAAERRRTSEAQLAAQARALREQYDREHRDLQAAFDAERARLEGILDALQARVTEQLRVLRDHLDDQYAALGSLEAQLDSGPGETAVSDAATLREEGVGAPGGPVDRHDGSGAAVADAELADPTGGPSDEAANGETAADGRPPRAQDAGELPDAAGEPWPSDADPVGLRVRVREDVEAAEESERRPHDDDGPAVSAG